MSNVYEVIVDGGARVEFVKGDHAFVENGFLHIQSDTGENVALFATFDYVTVQSATKEE